MSAKDLYHDNVVNALVKEGWTITHDPLRILTITRAFYMKTLSVHSILQSHSRLMTTSFDHHSASI